MKHRPLRVADTIYFDELSQSKYHIKWLQDRNWQVHDTNKQLLEQVRMLEAQVKELIEFINHIVEPDRVEEVEVKVEPEIITLLNLEENLEEDD